MRKEKKRTTPSGDVCSANSNEVEHCQNGSVKMKVCPYRYNVLCSCYCLQSASAILLIDLAATRIRNEPLYEFAVQANKSTTRVMVHAAYHQICSKCQY